MKLKEIQRTANVAWSPACHYPVYLAAGTAAQQLDATFSTTASLELYHMSLNDSGKEMELAGEIETDSRFYKLVWGAHGIESKTSVSGLLIGGAEQGQIYVWDAAKIISKEDPLVQKFDKHCGPVTTLDINPFQINLVASGASESEIFIWDLNSPEKPMTPGNKAQPAHDVTCLAWNQQVQHIIASSHGGNCIVWDLRKNEPIIKIRDSMSHIKCGTICWHPDVATQLCIASEDDHTPVIQLWDLRSATSPLKISENHQRGILSMSWCPSDPDLLLSSGKDNRILCWNPNSEFKMGEVVYELSTGNQWSFDVQWCPRNPAVISSCSFDGHVTVHSIMGDASQSQSSSTITGSTSFDPFSHSVSQYGSGDAVLKKPPKWMRRTVGASFAFGGKLVCFGNDKVPAGQQQARPSRPVYVSQVVTETELVSRSVQLENTLANGYYTEFCDEKIANSQDLTETTVWSFLKVNFERDTRQQYLKLLGYTQSAVQDQVKESLHSGKPNDAVVDQGGNTDLTVDNSSPFDSIVSTTVQEPECLSISVGNDPDGLITQSLLTANFEAAVDVCLSEGRMAEALVLAIAGGAELLARTQKAFFDANKSNVDRLMWAIVTQNFESVVSSCDLNDWKEALAIVLTYTAGQQFTSLCNLLGRRLETEAKGELAANAHICYIVAGNVEQLVASWSNTVANDTSYQSLQALVEKVMILKNGVELSMQGLTSSSGSCLAEKLSRYADILASQGCIRTAMNYLSSGSMDDKSIAVLVDRMSQSLGIYGENVKSVQKPFNSINVVPVVSQQLPVAAVVARQHPANADSFSQHQQNADTNFMSKNYMGQVPVDSRIRHDSNPAAETNRMISPVPVQSASSLSKGLSKKYGVVQPAHDLQTAHDYNQYQQPQYPSPVSAPQPYNLVNPASYSTTGAFAATGSVYPQYQPPSGSQYPLSSGTQFQSTNGAQYQSPSGAQYPSSTAVHYKTATGAWNDPPVVKDAVKPSYSDYSTGPSGFEGRFLNPAEYQPTIPTAKETYSGQFTASQPQVQPVEPSSVSAPQVQPPSKLSGEHQILQDIFDRLVEACSSRGSHNPQIKKKLEDVLRKLDFLYTQLLNGKLSQSTVDGLHRIVLAVQQYDYQTALGEHARIVSGGSFTEISHFIPGIKVLIQTAMQLQVYI